MRTVRVVYFDENEAAQVCFINVQHLVERTANIPRGLVTRFLKKVNPKFRVASFRLWDLTDAEVMKYKVYV